jgi:hypothetical protein
MGRREMTLEEYYATTTPEQQAANLRRAVAKHKRKAFTAMKGKDDSAAVKAVLEWMWTLGSHERIDALVPFLYKTAWTDEVFWRIFLGIWCICDHNYGWSCELDDLINMAGPCPPHLLPDREFYDSLPQEFTVYRGGDRSIEGGISWTTSVKVAEYFARGNRCVNSDPVVAIASVRKNEIYAATNDRNESEVLCQPNIIEVRPGTLRWDVP